MNFIPRILSRHRRARLIAWALAMLVWMARVLMFETPFLPRHERQRHTAMSLDRMTRMVKMLIISRAIDLAGRRRRRKPRLSVHYRGRTVTARRAIRATIGVRVQRMLKRKDIGERIAVLIHALMHLDHYATFVAKRLKRGLTRRLRALFALAPAPAMLVVALTARETCFADSS